MGHEYAGVIAELGPDVTGWQVGDRVMSGLGRPCGQCAYCRKGLHRLCYGGYNPITKIIPWARVYGRIQGAYAEYVTMRAAGLVRLPEEVSLAQGAICEPLAVAIGSAVQGRITLGDTVAIIGAGPIGLMAVQLARIMGSLDVYVSEPNKVRAEMARKFGATEVFDPREVDAFAEITRLTEIGPDVVIETAGIHATIEGSTELVRRGGRVVYTGLPFEPMPLRVGDWIMRNIEVSTSLGGSRILGMELLKRRKIDVDTLVTGIVPLEGVQDALMKLLHPSEHIKILVEP